MAIDQRWRARESCGVAEDGPGFRAVAHLGVRVSDLLTDAKGKWSRAKRIEAIVLLCSQQVV